MAVYQQSVDVRNARLDAIEIAIGTSPILRIRTGAPPASCAAADTGTVLATLTLPADWMDAASSGEKAKLGTWEDSSADATGTAGHWRIYASDGTTCHLQGDCSDTGGTGALKLVTTSLVAGQPVLISSFAMQAANS